MTAPDTLPVIPAIIISITTIIIWACLIIGDRRRRARTMKYFEDVIWEWLGAYRAGQCARSWVTGKHLHICHRPDEHTGPCLDGEELLRR